MGISTRVNTPGQTLQEKMTTETASNPFDKKSNSNKKESTSNSNSSAPGSSNYYRAGMTAGAASGSFSRGGFLGSNRPAARDNFDRYDNQQSSGQALPQGLTVTADLPPLKKDFYKEHADVAKMNPEEVIAFRKEHQMNMIGKDIPKPISSFDQAGFPEALQKRIAEQKFDKPTPIQAQGWPMALSGRNMVGIAQTGSGKTLSYILPALVHIMAQPALKQGDGPIALVLAPTRELAYQIQEVARVFGSAVRVRNACVYGGTPKGPQIRTLKFGAEIVIATPGRLIDLMEIGCINLSRVSFLVLDEADRMLDMGFEPQLRDIIPKIRADRQVLMWSATWPKSVQRLSHDLLGNNFIQVTIGSTDLTANKKIKQVITVCEEFDKERKLAELLQSLWDEIPGEDSEKQMIRTIVFSNKKRVCEDLVWKLRKEQWPAVALHGDKTQQERDAALNDFKRGNSPILVCTDVAARGLDVKDVRVVVNFDFPVVFEDYVHRIGRTARGSSTDGRSFAFFTSDNRGTARELIELLKEAGQEVPQSLKDIAPAPRGGHGGNFRGNGKRSFRGGRGGGRGGYQNKRGRPY